MTVALSDEPLPRKPPGNGGRITLKLMEGKTHRLLAKEPMGLNTTREHSNRIISGWQSPSSDFLGIGISHGWETYRICVFGGYKEVAIAVGTDEGNARPGSGQAPSMDVRAHPLAFL